MVHVYPVVARKAMSERDRWDLLLLFTSLVVRCGETRRARAFSIVQCAGLYSTRVRVCHVRQSLSVEKEAGNGKREEKGV